MGTKYNAVNWIPGWTFTVTQCFGGKTVSVANFPFVAENQVTKGENFRDWKYRIANGLDATTAMSGVLYTRSSNVAFMSGSASPKFPWVTCQDFPHVSGNGGIMYGVNLSIGPQPDVTSLVTADNKAKTKFISRAREVQTSFQGGVFIGELGETLRMLKSPVKTLRNGLSSYLGTLKKRRRQVRRSSPKKRLSVARNILADTWLEYSFGWKPLLSDIDDILDTIAKARSSVRERWRPINASGVDERFSSSTQSVFSNSLIVDISVNVNRYAKQQVTYRGCVNVEFPAQQVSKHLGNFTEDFVPTVWELIPYSFLVDYFTNIGDIVSAATYARSHLRWVNRTEVSFLESEIMGSPIVTPNTSGFLNISAKCSPIREHRTRKSFSRASYGGSLVPILVLEVPGWGNKWLNMAALLAGQRDLVPFHR